jgi:putative oxidoreductase
MQTLLQANAGPREHVTSTSHFSTTASTRKEPMVSTDQPYVGAVGRLLIAALFLISGLAKIATPALTQGFIASAGLPFPLLAYLVAIVVEVGGGTLLILGYQSRIVASVMAVYTVAAALSFHSNFADQNAMAHFLKNISITGGLLQIVALGAGTFSIDGRLARHPRSVGR